jgi:hypothetical protein
MLQATHLVQVVAASLRAERPPADFPLATVGKSQVHQAGGARIVVAVAVCCQATPVVTLGVQAQQPDASMCIQWSRGGS